MELRKKLYIAMCCMIMPACAGCAESTQKPVSPAENTPTEASGISTVDNTVHIVSVDLQDASAAKGSDFLLPVLFDKNDGFAGISLDITYDNTLLQFQKIELSDTFGSYPNVSDCTEIPKSNIVRVSYVFGEDIQETGRFAVLHFRVRKKAETRAFASVNVRIQEAAGTDGRKMAGNEKCIQISIKEPQADGEEG